MRSAGGVSCAAWRLVGRSPSGPLDDAGVGVFDLYQNGRVVATVASADALVDVGRMPRIAPVLGDDALVELLGSRGAADEDWAACLLAEGAIVDGDTVEVTGSARTTVVATGPRDTVEIARFEVWPTIRKVR